MSSGPDPRSRATPTPARREVGMGAGDDGPQDGPTGRRLRLDGSARSRAPPTPSAKRVKTPPRRAFCGDRSPAPRDRSRRTSFAQGAAGAARLSSGSVSTRPSRRSTMRSPGRTSSWSPAPSRSSRRPPAPSPTRSKPKISRPPPSNSASKPFSSRPRRRYFLSHGRRARASAIPRGTRLLVRPQVVPLPASNLARRLVARSDDARRHAQQPRRALICLGSMLYGRRAARVEAASALEGTPHAPSARRQAVIVPRVAEQERGRTCGDVRAANRPTGRRRGTRHPRRKGALALRSRTRRGRALGARGRVAPPPS